MKAHILGIGLANPPHVIKQSEAVDFMVAAHQLTGTDRDQLKALYRATGIKQRYSVLNDYSHELGSFHFYPNHPDLEPFPTTAQRMSVYRPAAVKMGVEAIENCLEQSKVNKDTISHLITVSCTGMYAPGLDMDLIQALSLSTSIERTAINFMGCYAALTALKVARSICQADAQAAVLIVCVEICTIHFQKQDTEDYRLSNALFGDGAAAVILKANATEQKSLSVETAFGQLMPSGKTAMAWDIGNFGFEMKLAAYVPDLIGAGIKDLIDKLLAQIDLPLEAIDFYAVHPGGKKILQRTEEALEIEPDRNRYAYQVLRDHGNMSSPTVLFVLRAIWDDLISEDQGKHILSFAFGPGLTMESMVFKVH